MPLFQHRYQGHLAAGDIFVFSWWSDTSLTIDTSHGNAVQWATDFFAGPGGTDGYGAFTSTAVGIDRITTGEITTATGQQQSLRESVVTLTGDTVGTSLPQEVALVVSLRTALANRSGRGRFYLPQPSENATTDTGRLSGTAQTDIVAALDFAWGNSNAAGELPVIYSRTNRTTQAITSFDVGDLFDVQTRRQNSLTQVRVSEPMP